MPDIASAAFVQVGGGWSGGGVGGLGLGKGSLILVPHVIKTDITKPPGATLT